MDKSVGHDAVLDLASDEAGGPGVDVDVAWGSRTDVGLVREVNEDAVLARPPVFLVADGMGGYAAGDIASATVVREFGSADGQDYVTPQWILESFDRAETHIRDEIPGGTTVAGAAVVRQDGRPYWLVFNIGDSRVYHCAEGALSQVTVDHSVVQEMVDAGALDPAQARVHPKRHIITRAVGAPETVRPDFWLLPIVAGGRLLICSDGLTSEVDDERIGSMVCVAEPPQVAADRLVAAARDAGGRDNISVIVIDVISTGDPGDGHLDDSRTRPRALSADAIADEDERTSPRTRMAAGYGDGT